MVTSVTLSLDTRRAKKDGSFPLVLRISHQQYSASIPLKIAVHEKDWDSKNRVIRKTFKDADSITRLNNEIRKKRTDAMDIVMKLHEAGQLETMSVTELKDKIETPIASHSFFSFTQQIVDELKQANRFGTARSYQCVLSVLRDFAKGKELSFKQVNYTFLTKFETHHVGKGNTGNGLGVYMRTIRAIYNKAIKSGVADKELYPFSDYKVKTKPTQKRALEWEQLKKIIELQLLPGHPLFNTRNYFVASYLMYGMNFADMAHLKQTDIAAGRIQYRRRKTSKLYDIKVTATLQPILSYYQQQAQDGYVFPIIKRKEAALQDKDIQWARKRYNKKLKTLAELCEITQNLTSYVSRHSFATQAMLQEVPLNAISSMLGHSSLKTTEVYLKGLPTNILDDYNERIVTSN